MCLLLITGSVSSECSGKAFRPDFVCRESGDLLGCSVGGLRVDPRRLVCGVVEKGFLPCLISFAVMDFVVIPQLRRRWDR